MANNSKNILNDDVEIRGNLKCSGDLAFNGTIEGDLASEGNLELGESTKVKGNVHAKNALVRGKIAGNISSKERLEIKSGTELTGDLKASKLVMEDGVQFVGRAEINPTKAVPADAPNKLRPGEAYKASEPSRMGR